MKDRQLRIGDMVLIDSEYYGPEILGKLGEIIKCPSIVENSFYLVKIKYIQFSLNFLGTELKKINKNLITFV